MKLTIFILAFAILAIIPQAFAMDDTTKIMAEPTLKAIAFHSDSCGSCKILGPKMKDAMGAINQDRIDVVKFDFTNKETIAKTKELANSKGVNNILQQFGAKTGFVVIVNKDGNVVDKLKVNDSTAEIAAKLAKAIASAS